MLLKEGLSRQLEKAEGFKEAPGTLAQVVNW